MEVVKCAPIKYDLTYIALAVVTGGTEAPLPPRKITPAICSHIQAKHVVLGTALRAQHQLTCEGYTCRPR